MDFGTTTTIAWRNIWRNKTRTVLTLLAIGFATGVLVFFVSLQLSSYATSINATVRLFQGHLQVQREGYLDEPRMRSVIPEANALRQQIARLPEVEAAALRASGFALVSSNERSYGVSIIGVEPKLEPRVSSIPGVIRKGRYLEHEFEAILGSYLAQNLQVEVGDELTILGQGFDGSLAAGILKVVGTFESGSNDIDRSMLQISLESFESLFSFPNAAHAIVVRLDSLESVMPLERVIEELLPAATESVPRYAVLRWDELVPGLKEAIELDMASGWLFYLSLILIVAFSILNTFWMSVLERTKEFAILLALGTKPRSIIAMVLLECAWLTLVGIICGLVFGSSLIAYFGAEGFSVPGSEEIVKKWNVPAVVYTRFSVEALTQGPLILWIVAVIAVLYPALRIARLQPVQALSGRN